MPDPPAAPLMGEIFALLAPLCWSVAIILFRMSGRTVPPVALNLFKNTLALVLFTLTLFVLGTTPFEGMRSRDVLLLVLSGAIGIGLSDTFFFMCLNRVGAGLQAIVNTSYSPVIIVLSVVFLGERLSLLQSLGALLIVGAVLAVGWVRDRKAHERVPHRVSGILFGLAGTTTQGVSIVMVKRVLEDNPVVWATWWRLLGGLAVGAVIMMVSREQRATLPTLTRRAAWPVMIAGAVMGTYVSLLLWIGGMKYAPASIAAALNQTATLWTFLLAVLVLHEPTTKRRLAGLALGAAGVLLVTLQSMI